MDPRPYQEKAIRHIIEYAAEHPSGKLLVVLPPGGGKTLIAACVLRLLAADQGMRGLTWAHRRELVGQMRDHLIRCGVPKHMLGVVMAGDKRINPSAHIQVTSVDTLRHRDKPPADIVVSDEAHRDASDGRRKLRAMYPDALQIGFTATPERLDGRGLASEYDDMFIAAQPSELIADGYLAAPKIFTVPKELLPDVRGIKSVHGEYHPGELEAATNRGNLVGGIVDHWQRRANGRRTLVFPVGLAHSRAIVKQFQAAGIAAAHLDGETSNDDRGDMLRDLAAGRLKVVSSCGVLSEGVDIPAVKCVVFARPTKSLMLTIQQGGRCMRPWRKTTPLILDHAGNVMVHWPPHSDREWSLESKKRPTLVGRAPFMACEECFAIIPSGCKTCPECACVFRVADPIPEELSGELVEYHKMFTAEQRAAELERLRAVSKRQGLPEGFAERIYAAKFGEDAAA